jgi:hypothetical protein
MAQTIKFAVMHMLRLVLGLVLHGAALGQAIVWLAEGRYLLGALVTVVVLAMLVVVRAAAHKPRAEKRVVPKLS